jgi:hypothetical protein
VLRDNSTMPIPGDTGRAVHRPTAVWWLESAVRLGATSRVVSPRQPISSTVISVCLMVLAGCSTVQPTNSWHSGTGAANTGGVQADQRQPIVENGDPLLRLVGTMPITVDQGFREPATGEVLRVRVLRAYAAASGRPCREFATEAAGGVEQHRVACEDGSRWVAARPLRQETTESTATRVP